MALRNDLAAGSELYFPSSHGRVDEVEKILFSVVLVEHASPGLSNSRKMAEHRRT